MSEPNSDSASELLHIKTTAAAVAQAHLAPRAAEIDREGRWPRENFQALAQAGLLGLTVPRQFGGLGQGFTGLVTVVQELARACSSTALCYGMHCVASKVLSVCPTPGQAHRYLEPIARGEHVTTLALSEPGTGVHFYLPRVSFHPENNVFVVNGTKTFVSNGGHADSYVISVVAEGAEYDPGTFSTLVVDADAAGVEWQESWEGLGMRGNASRGVRLRDVRVPSANLLGREGDETWHLFEVVAPYFQAAMAAVYAGIASAAVNLTASHLRAPLRSYGTSARRDRVAHPPPRRVMDRRGQRVGLCLARRATRRFAGTTSALQPDGLQEPGGRGCRACHQRGTDARRRTRIRCGSPAVTAPARRTCGACYGALHGFAQTLDRTLITGSSATLD